MNSSATFNRSFFFSTKSILFIHKTRFWLGLTWEPILSINLTTLESGLNNKEFINEVIKTQPDNWSKKNSENSYKSHNLKHHVCFLGKILDLIWSTIQKHHHIKPLTLKVCYLVRLNMLMNVVIRFRAPHSWKLLHELVEGENSLKVSILRIQRTKPSQ